MNGRYVERRFGWDCHGLPVEHEIDKKLGIKHRGDILTVFIIVRGRWELINIMLNAGQ